jgi:epoxyqueuosine reductase
MRAEKRIRETAAAEGAGFFGVADLSAAREEIARQGGADVARYPRGISIGIALPHPIVDALPRRAERAVAVSYKRHAYDVINQRLDLLCSRIAGILQGEGFRTMPISAAVRVDDERICAAFSHKLCARLAGLGWIGRSCLLVTPESGPRVRWATILTDAPFSPTGEPMAQRCGDCMECVRTCPMQAFTGKPFLESEPREARFDASKCHGYFEELKKKGVETAVCGMCLYVCPFGRKQGGPRSP